MRAGGRFTQAPGPADPEVSGGSEAVAVVEVEATIPVEAVVVDFREAEVTVAAAVRAVAGDPTGDSA